MITANKWLVTGGAGFVGSHLCQRLAEDGKQVLVVDVDVNRVKPGVQYVEYGLENYRRFELDVKDFRPDVIVHLAAVSSVPACEGENGRKRAHQNVHNTYTVLKAVQRFNVPRLVFASSSAVYGPPKVEGKAIPEDHPLEPVNTYGLTKRAGERLVDAYNELGYSAISLRFANVYGPGGRSVADRFLQARKAGETGRFNPTNVSRDFVYVGDVVSAILAVAPLQVLRTPFNVGSGGPAYSVSELADMLDLPTTPVAPPSYAEPPHIELDIHKLLALGWTPTTTLDSYYDKEIELEGA